MSNIQDISKLISLIHHRSFIELSRSIESLSRVVHEAGPMSNPLPVSRTIARRRRSSLKPLDNAVLWTDAAPDDDG